MNCMSLQELSLPNTRHQPNVMQQQTTMPQNQPHSTITFGAITHQINPGSFARAIKLQHQKANSYSQSAFPVNTKARQKHAGSDHFEPSKVQHKSLPPNTKHAPRDIDLRTAVSNWLATSQTFEKPSRPASIVDSSPPYRHGREYWLEISKDLDLRLKSHSVCPQAPIQLEPGRVYESPITNSYIHELQSQIQGSDPDGLFSHNLLGPRAALAFEKKVLSGRCLFDVQEKLGRQMREQKHQEQNLAAKVPSKQLEVTEPKKANETIRAKEKKEQLEVFKLQKPDEAVKAKAKKLAADAMAAHKKEQTQERMKCVDGRAWDIHENLLRCKPFDIDAVRREFSEKEVQEIKTVVRELGFEKKK